MEKKCVIMLSGGLDSATILAKAKSENYHIFALTFNYHQRNNVEIKFATNLAKLYNVDHKIITVDLRAIGGSALTDDKIDITNYSDANSIPPEVTTSYVPARNTIFLSLALAYAETVGANEIFCGANKSDYDNYPDCREDFFTAFQQVANLGTKAATSDHKYKISTPLINMEKKDIIKLGNSLGLDYANTISCYNPSDDGTICNICLSCIIRKKNFDAV
jgi:7-cyano-7-deazaguanine synthase